MHYQTDFVSHWRTGFKERIDVTSDDEVPKWKRDLLKRIHSKNRRMTEEQSHADVLEEHIPKVSNNIFLTQEKSKVSSSAALRTAIPEINPTPHRLLTLSVDNVIIIEKEAPVEVDEPTSSHASLDYHKEEKEFPVAGIVQRLMGKFQEPKLANYSEKSPSSCVESVQGSETDNIQNQDPLLNRCADIQIGDFEGASKHSIAPPCPQQLIPMEEKSLSTILSPQHTQSSVFVDLLSPLLRSSARPFSKQSMENASDHGYHHVSIPIRKFSAAPNPKDKPMLHTDVSSIHTSKAQVFKPGLRLADKEVRNADSPKPGNPSYTTCFGDDLSTLHSSNTPSTPFRVKETVIIEKESSESISNGRINLPNGETLHSCGNDEKLQDLKKEISAVKQAKQLFERKAYAESTANGSKSSQNPVEMSDSGTREALITPKKTGLNNDYRKTEPSSKPIIKNTCAPCPQIPTHEVCESFHEYVLESQAVRADGCIMQTSKPIKITSSKTDSKTPKVPSLSLYSRPLTKLSTLQQEKSTLVLNKCMSESGMCEVETAQGRRPQSIEEKRAKPPHLMSKNLSPSVSFGDLAQDSELNSANNSILYSMKPSALDGKTNSKLEASGKPQEILAFKSLNFPTNKTANYTTSEPPKFGSDQRLFSLPAKKTIPSRGSTFVIDPSKFRTSSSVVSAAQNASHSIQQESRNTRMIVPRAGSMNTTEMDSTDDFSKAGKRKLRVEQIIVIGGYVTLEKSSLAKATKIKKNVSLSFSETLETTYTYISERSLLQDDSTANLKMSSPDYQKGSAIGKYTPKFLLSMKTEELVEDDEDTISSKNVEDCSYSENDSSFILPAPSNDQSATWSDTTSSSTDILF